jgi:hypothetical protein
MAKTSQRAALCSRWPALWLTIALLTAAPASAQLVFDVFVGHGLGLADSTVAEANWFPVTCEIQNDGPGFNALVEISAGQFGGGQTRLVQVELPTNTKKRFIVPVYCNNRYRTSIDARLFNEKRKVIAERLGVEARTVVDWQSPLIASLSRTHGGAAALPDAGRGSPLRPATTHLLPELFSDNPLTLESISSLYLHSARVLELKAPQVNALLAWIHGGGHLILAVEQPGDVKGAAWLRGFLPCTLGDVAARREGAPLQRWLQSTPLDHSLRPGPSKAPGKQTSIANPYSQLASDGAFEAAEMPVVSATVRDGSVLVGSDTAPLIVSARRGRGQVTVLLFSPELEPFRSWKNKNWLWARLGDVPLEWLASANVANSGSMSLDGVFGAMVDSKQVRKLPVGWLLLLLLAYLVVIGPLDHYWLRKINKQMLTWITFPTYVALFSLLIYFIGYKLRSGEMEWNELHVVDVTPHGDRADLRGRVYCSAYSPANARYSVASDQGYSTLRGEIGQGGVQELSKATIEQRGNGFTAQLSVPVWTSQLFVNDWWKQAASPLQVAATRRGDQLDIRIENVLGKKIPQARLIVDGRIHELGDITKGRTLTVSRTAGSPLQPFVQNHVNQFSQVVQQRQRQFGGQESGRLSDVFNATTASSFLDTAQLSDPSQGFNAMSYYSRFTTPAGFDLTPLMRRGDVILLAWIPGETIVPALNQFTPRYSRKETVLRVAVAASP